MVWLKIITGRYPSTNQNLKETIVKLEHILASQHRLALAMAWNRGIIASICPLPHRFRVVGNDPAFQDYIRPA